MVIVTLTMVVLLWVVIFSMLVTGDEAMRNSSLVLLIVANGCALAIAMDSSIDEGINANPFVPIPPNGLHARITQELNELRAISAMIDSHLKRVDHTMLPNEIDMDDLEFEDELIVTPLVSPFLDSDDKSDDGEVVINIKLIPRTLRYALNQPPHVLFYYQ
ncbi:hypothetical protein Tco_1377091 [Tanacetum coccineum]